MFTARASHCECTRCLSWRAQEISWRLACFKAFKLLQVAQIFALEGPTSEMLQPATKKDLLAALLAVLRDTSWAHAVRCPAEPAFMTPISCSTALDPTRLPCMVWVRWQP